MKLRNKKRLWEIGEPRVAYQEIYVDTTEHKTYYYKTIAELNEEWEDYKPKEPLIKDPKILKAVRAWAEANGADRVILGQVNNDELVKKSAMTAFGCHISFEGSLGLERGRNYAITELCGEEE